MSLYPRILATAFFSLASSQLLANVTAVSMPAASITGAYAVAVGSQSSSQSIFRNDIVESGIYGNHFGYPEVSANVSILINEDPSPSLFVNASTDAINIGGITAQAYADAQLRYYFRIVGPSGQVPVTI